MQQTPGERFVERVRPAILPTLVVLGVALLVVHARQRLAGSPRFTVDPAAWEVRSRPDWVSDPLAASLARRISAGLLDVSSLLDGGDLADWAHELPEITPWIESVERIEPRFPGQADVRLRLRRPVMSVDGELLLSADGRVLGEGDIAVHPEPLQYEGRHLDEEDIREAAAAAAELVPFRDELDALGVRVETVGIFRDDTVVFRTDRDVLLSWGRSAQESDRSYMDLPFHARIENLKTVLVDYPGLAGVERVQLWTDKPVVWARGG